jgi:hypothetical protein
MKTLKELLTEAWVHQYGNGKPLLNYEIKAVQDWLTQKRQIAQEKSATAFYNGYFFALDELLEELKQ